MENAAGTAFFDAAEQSLRYGGTGEALAAREAGAG
jgi:hypothetical protein